MTTDKLPSRILTLADAIWHLLKGPRDDADMNAIFIMRGLIDRTQAEQYDNKLIPRFEQTEMLPPVWK